MAKKIKDENRKAYVQKSPFYKEWWFILIVVLIAYGAIKGGSSSTETTQTTSSSEKSEVITSSSSAEEASGLATSSSEKSEAITSSSSAEEASGLATSSEEKAEINYKIGDLVKVGYVEYIVNSKTTAQNIGGEFGQNANGTYLILNVTVKNNGSKSITVTDSFFKLLKGKITYEADSAAGIYANEDAKFFLTDLNPENTVTGNVVFDLNPETANDPNLQLQVQTGYWGTQKGIINLN